MIEFNNVKDQTTEEYFNNNVFSIDAFNRKYSAYEGETYVQALKRVCEYVASVEKTEDAQVYWAKRWFDEIYNDWWHPAGSIMQGSGINRKISLANCTTISMGVNEDDKEWDNLESIFKNTAYTVSKTAAYRQGLGVDFSRLRPKGSLISNSANESTGAIHWMKLIDSIGYYVGQCLDGDVLINTDKGKIKIKEIVESDKEYYAETHKGYKKIISKFNNGKKDIFELSTDDGDSILLTKDHRVVIKDLSDNKYKIVKVEDLNVETDLLVKKVE